MAFYTVNDRMETLGRQWSGFDYLRLVLAVAVIAFHTIIVCYGPDAEHTVFLSGWRPLIHFIVPMFFALSGFLVAGSLERIDRLPLFLTSRFLRIFPALCFEVVICALIIGPVFTVFPLEKYFSQQDFFKYFLNVLGDVHFFLPGVFRYNMDPFYVNVQLWTIPWELACYGLLTLAALIRLVKHPLWFALALCLYMVAACTVDIYTGQVVQASQPRGHFLEVCFLWGVFLHLYRDKIPYGLVFFGIAFVLSWLLLISAWTEYLAAFPLAYMTVYLGLANPPRTALIDTGDYSYGLYLYGFPLQQVLWLILPLHRQWYVNFPLSVLAAGLCAFVSWNIVEYFVLTHKKRALASVDALTMRLQSALESPDSPPKP